ncbi:3-keto-5-aminohexanoate cleavage protein [Rhodococcus sp. T2V]|uniref:3-keto-5-aminohexanoate cleavage protein n=1 Tax=Rhodococcus sp. T2V TaxID=3034164 RepID=UPI0031FF449C|nr:3-keto-5-aminohexanoate cleavage protein [Rhodococcus sp. T2V]
MGIILTVAPTGPIATTADNPHLPTQPHEIADAVAAAYTAGASVAHLHFRDGDGRPTADLGIASETIGLISDRCPILIQLSTGVGLSVPFEARAALVELRPRMATLNPCNMSFGDGEFRNPPKDVRRLAARMRDLGIKPELEIYDTGHLEACLRLRDEGLLDDERMQFSIVLGVRGGMAATADNLLTMVRRLPADCVWQVVAVGRMNLNLTAIALALGGNARAGLEDTLYLRRGELSAGNQPLIERTTELVCNLDLTLANVEEAERLLNLPARATVSAPDVSTTREVGHAD